MPGALDRAQQERARLQAAQEVPVALLGGVDGEEIQGPADHEPQHVRPLQLQTAQTGAVDGRAQTAQGMGHRVALARSHDRRRVNGCHVSAP
ncbi:hypothetical protein FBY35_1225 [Streptomyces sp. SLBN-118]|nr:hypothetical protein FBY35_1225 [Streptomyces sp. SLBN-118]